MTISPNLILPLAHFCIDTNPSPINRPCCPALFIAPMLSTGTATVEKPYIIATVPQAEELFGLGSIAADMANYYFLNNPFGELYIVALADLGPYSTGTIDVVGPATNNGTLSIRIADIPYYVNVAVGDTSADILGDLESLINNDQSAVITASITSATQLTITAKNGGSQGADITILLNDFYGEETPEGLTVTITDMSTVVSTYDIGNALASIGDCCYDFIGVPFTDSAILSELEAFMVANRWNCDKLIGGRWYTTNRDNFTDQFTFIQNNKYRFGSANMSCPGDPNTTWQETAAYIGQTHLSACAAPWLSWYNYSLNGIRCTNKICDEQCFNENERNILATYGGTVTTCGTNGFKQIELEASLGVASTSDNWRYPQLVYQTMRLIRDMKVFIIENFSRTLIVDDLTQVPDGSNVVTPTVILSSLKAWMLETQNLNVDNIRTLEQFVKIERDAYNPSRININMTIDFTNALRIIAVNITPKLNINTGVFS